MVARCLGGAGLVAMTAEKAAGGGTAATAHLTGLRKARWFGGLLFGHETFTSQAPQHTAENGRFDDQADSVAPWGSMTLAYYFSADSRESCIVMAEANSRRVHAGADYVGLIARVQTGQLLVYATTDDDANAEWRVGVRIKGVDGSLTRLHQRFPLDDSANGRVLFTGVAAVQGVHQIRVRFSPVGHHGPAPIWTMVTAA